jgi:hypothetical protein
MIGVNILGFNVLIGIRVFWEWSLIFGPFATSFVSLRAFVLEPDFQARLKCFLGRPTWPLLSTSWQI